MPPHHASSSGASTNASSGAGGNPVKKTVTIEWASFSHEDVLKYMPCVSGLRMVREKNLAHRWRVSYPRDVLPQSFSLVYHDVATESASVKACLPRAWRVHSEECTRNDTLLEECP